MFNLNIYKDKVRLTSHAEFFCVCFSACSVNVDFFTVLFKANTLKLQFSSDVIKGGKKKITSQQSSVPAVFIDASSLHVRMHVV